MQRAFTEACQDVAPNRCGIERLPLATRLHRGHQPIAASAALGAETRAALDFAGLFVELADPHFILDAASLDELTEAADGLLSRFFIAQRQFNHRASWILNWNPSLRRLSLNRGRREPIWESAILARTAAIRPGELRSRGLVHFSASQRQVFRQSSTENMDLTPSPLTLQFSRPFVHSTPHNCRADPFLKLNCS